MVAECPCPVCPWNSVGRGLAGLLPGTSRGASLALPPFAVTTGERVLLAGPPAPATGKSSVACHRRGHQVEGGACTQGHQPRGWPRTGSRDVELPSGAEMGMLQAPDGSSSRPHPRASWRSAAPPCPLPARAWRSGARSVPMREACFAAAAAQMSGSIPPRCLLAILAAGVTGGQRSPLGRVPCVVAGWERTWPGGLFPPWLWGRGQCPRQPCEGRSRQPVRLCTWEAREASCSRDGAWGSLWIVLGNGGHGLWRGSVWGAEKGRRGARVAGAGTPSRCLLSSGVTTDSTAPSES